MCPTASTTPIASWPIRRPLGGGGKIVVRVKVGAADSGVGDADQGFGGLLDGEIGDSTIQTSPDFYISVAFKVFLQSRAQW